MSLFEFAGPDQPDLAGRAALVGSALQGRGLETLETVLGAGLIWWQDILHVTVIVAQESVQTDKHGIFPLHEISLAWELMQAAFGPTPPEWLPDVLAFVLPSPHPYLSPGDWISSPNVGTVGCGVSWNGGVGFLTAGHVAPNRGGTVSDGRTALGTVREASNPANSGTAAKADVSLVEVANINAFSRNHGGAVAAGPTSRITVWNARRNTGIVMAFCTFCHWPKVKGTYGDTYLTTSDISTGGDSGSAVLDCNNDVIGLVVGGTPGITTFIQDVRYQLAQLRPPSTNLVGLSI